MAPLSSDLRIIAVSNGEGLSDARRMIGPMSKLLEGFRILDVSQFAAGPYGTMILADPGAEVIKIEDSSTG